MILFSFVGLLIQLFLPKFFLFLCKWMYSYLSREKVPLRTSNDIHWGNKMLVAGSLLTFLLYKNCIWFYNISLEYCFYNFVRLDLSVKKRVIKTIYFLLWCTFGRYIWDYRSRKFLVFSCLISLFLPFFTSKYIVDTWKLTTFALLHQTTN